jgi:hypothetical protein
MTFPASTGGRSRSLILTAMIFAVSMTFIDQTIILIVVPQIQRGLRAGRQQEPGELRAAPKIVTPHEI